VRRAVLVDQLGQGEVLPQGVLEDQGRLQVPDDDPLELAVGLGVPQRLRVVQRGPRLRCQLADAVEVRTPARGRVARGQDRAELLQSGVAPARCAQLIQKATGWKNAQAWRCVAGGT